VRNRADGTVEAEIEGPPEAVAAVVVGANGTARRVGRSAARHGETEEGSSVFEIRRDG
jgi:acylphosphatase